MDGALGWKFTIENIPAAGISKVYAFSPEQPTGQLAKFSVIVDCDGMPDLNTDQQRERCVFFGKRIAVVKILLGQWESHEDSTFTLLSLDDPVIGSDSVESFETVAHEITKALYREYVVDRPVILQPTALALVFGITKSSAAAVLQDLASREQIAPAGSSFLFKLTHKGADAARKLSLETASADEDSTIQYDVFLSHASADDLLAERVRKILKKWGISAFATPRSIDTGYWPLEIELALRESRHLLVILSESALSSSIWVHQELGYFLGYKFAGIGEDSRHRVHYVQESDESRPGMYEFIQGTLVSTLSDPIAVAQLSRANWESNQKPST